MNFKSLFAISLVCLTSVSTAFAKNPIPSSNELLNLVLRTSDAGFGGFYLDIEKTMETLGASRLQAHEIQNHLRDELETTAGSVSLVQQRPYLQAALANAVDAVIRRKQSESGYTPIEFKNGEFVVVLDLDETLLTHWYQSGFGEGSARKGSLFVPERDTVPVYVDSNGNSLPQTKLLLSPAAVQVRPGVETFFERVGSLPGFKGFVIFTAKEDRAAWAVRRVWEQRQPELFKKVVGFYTRNHLKFGPGLSKASKDLRIFDTELKHVVLVDDNEGRVLQKDLNFRIPKFNADAYIKSISKERDKRVAALNSALLPWLASRIAECVKVAAAASTEDSAFSDCYRQRLGRLSEEPHGELDLYAPFVESTGISLKGVNLEEVFHQPFAYELERPLSGAFQTYVEGRLAEPAL